MSEKLSALQVGPAAGSILYGVVGGNSRAIQAGLASGLATLDANGHLVASQMAVSTFNNKGGWDASTNTPTLADGTGTSGDAYLVKVAGTQNLGSGDIVFNIGDVVLYNGTIWEQIPHGGQFFVQIGGNSASATLDIGTTTDQDVRILRNSVPLITINNTGVGISVDTPMAPLHVGGGMLVEAGSVEYEVRLDSGTEADIGTTTNHPLNIKTNGATRVSIGAAGQTAFSANATFNAGATIPAGGLTIAAGGLNASGTNAFLGRTVVNGVEGSGVPGGGEFANLTSANTTAVGNAAISWNQALAPADQKWWDTLVDNSSFSLRTVSDDGQNNNVWLHATRTGLAITGITSDSGSGAWTHTGTFAVTDALTIIPNGQLTAASGYTPTAALSLATRGYVDTNAVLVGGNASTTALQIGTTTAFHIDFLVNNQVAMSLGRDEIVMQPTVDNGKIRLYDTSGGSNYTFYGFGVAAQTLIYQVTNSAADHVFYTTDGSDAQVELFRVKGTGDLAVPSGYTPATANSLADRKYVDSGVTAPLSHSGATLAFTPTTAQVNLVDATSADVSVTLPSAIESTPAGKRFTVKKVDSSSNTVTLTCTSGTIDGQSEQGIGTQWDFMTVVFDGTNWYVIG